MLEIFLANFINIRALNERSKFCKNGNVYIFLKPKNSWNQKNRKIFIFPLVRIVINIPQVKFEYDSENLVWRPKLFLWLPVKREILYQYAKNQNFAR